MNQLINVIRLRNRCVNARSEDPPTTTQVELPFGYRKAPAQRNRRKWSRGCVPAGRRIARAPNLLTTRGEGVGLDKSRPEHLAGNRSRDWFRDSGTKFGCVLSGSAFDYPFSSWRPGKDGHRWKDERLGQGSPSFAKFQFRPVGTFARRISVRIERTDPAWTPIKAASSTTTKWVHI
jgi:hypothetical protein